MRHAVALIALVMLTAPVQAEEGTDEGLSLMERGARLFFEGMRQELDPALKQLDKMADDMEPALRRFAETMGPALRDLMGEVEDWSMYHPPEKLPNGDIILRRKQPQDIPPPPEQGDEIEL